MFSPTLIVFLTMNHIIFLSRFRTGVKDLEVMVQNLIASAFETVTTSQEGAEILDIFQHLSSREVIFNTHDKFEYNNYILFLK